MYELYTRETDPKKRKVIKQYATDEEAAEDLGMSPKRIRQAAAYCKRYWYAGATASYVCLILERTGTVIPPADSMLAAKPRKKPVKPAAQQDEGYTPKFKQWFTIEWTKATQRILKGAGKCRTQRLIVTR